MVGQTKSAGFQVGKRKTFELSLQQAWDFIISDEGIRLWLGDIQGTRVEEGNTYRTRDGAEGEFRIVNPYSHIRLTWRPEGWHKASTIQVRVIPTNKSKTVISFHQENLLGEKERGIMYQKWSKVVEEIENVNDQLSLQCCLEDGEHEGASKK